MAELAYDRIGIGYRTRRRADSQIAKRLWGALGDSGTVLNVGAGAGSYEPVDRPVVAVEPSLTMIQQRPATAAPCVRALGEALPFQDHSFDAVLGVLTLHHWANLADGLRELSRVARKRIVLLTWDPESDEQFWLTRDYLPAVLEFDRARFPKMAELERHLGKLEVSHLPVPADCADGFRGSYWKRPQAYLNPDIQRSISSFAMLEPDVVKRFDARLAQDLDSGEWARRNEDLVECEAFDMGYRIAVAHL